MEPFVQRMLERAKARREKLDTQLSNAGHDIKKRRSPLKDANALLEQAAGKSCNMVSKSIAAESNEQINKENGEFVKCNARSQLQRLGKLYSDDDNWQLSSPIHKTEEKFSSEDSLDYKSAKRGARLDRLAALASTINNWEDDLSHPKLNKPTENKAEKIQAKFNEQVKNASEPQPSTSGYNKQVTNNTIKSKELKWDKTVLESLEAQGFNRSQSNSRLVYDYKDCSQVSVSRNQEIKKRNSLKNDNSPKSSKSEVEIKVSKSPASSFNNNSKDSKISDKQTLIKNANTTSSSRLPSRFGYNGSPKGSIQSSGSVLSKASMFEAKSTDVKVKDPAQMTLAERMALFERNKGEAPLIPKAPLTMSIPPKKLQEKDKNSSPISCNVDSNKIVSVQRAILEQNNKSKIDEIENHILQSTHAERQRELDMLRSRFNNNKEMTRAAIGSCIRTSESSEGKSSSPKSSPVCPVKPTPAPDLIVPPPPPPPPQPEIAAYHYKSSPIKRQVAGSPPKIQQSNVLSDIKRIRVCPPKQGSLYPNLTHIESTTESEGDTEYTVDNTEPETATLEKTETDTTTEADYYVQDDESDSESDQESVPANTSFGRSILHALDERSLFNKKRSIDPDPDSTTSDISVLDEMDQYLDECLAAEELCATDIAKEEGPTPPKINKAGKSPSAASNSFKYMEGFRSPLKVVSPSSPKKSAPYIENDGNRVPLMRTVSAYRRQQSELAKTPYRSSTRTKESDTVSGAEKRDESALIESRVTELLDEVCTQQKKIEGASKALNLCQSTVEFNGSTEHVGGEWALLVATHKRQAAMNEVQRLKREGTLRPIKAGSPEVQGSGSLTISAITLPFKQEFFRNMANNAYLHCVCLMRYLGEVVVTQAATAEPGDSCLRFTSTLKFDNLHSDFTIAVEIYTLQTQPKYLPHERKYHINNSGINKKATSKTPKKKSQFVMPSIQSPAGPTAVRSPAFQLSGITTINLRDIYREQFNLNGVSTHSPLEGYLRMHVSRKLSVSVEHRGFLTIFEDISGLGAWDRRWCLLKDARLTYWIHPEDEHKKTPIGSLDLEGICTKHVVFINREKCARPFTFLMETVRPAQSGDTDNLIMKTNGIKTTIEHFLLADTREEGLQWLSKLNKTLTLIRAWGPFRHPA